MTKHPPVVAFFNNKGGVGKTSLVYHLAWMFSDLGMRVLAVDGDPQANLTAAFLSERRLESLWPEEGGHPRTIFGTIEPLLTGTGDVNERPFVEAVSDKCGLIIGDLALSKWEDDLSLQWPKSMDREQRAFRVMSGLWRVIVGGAGEFDADVVLLDLGPNLGALNRAALVASDFLVVPLTPDLFSLQGLRNLGPRFVNGARGGRTG